MKNYRKKNVQPMEPWSEGMDLEGVSIGEDDTATGSPKEGDMIAVNPNRPEDKWLIASVFFQENYELAE